MFQSNITYDDHKGNSTLSVPKRCDADAPEGKATLNNSRKSIALTLCSVNYLVHLF